MDPSEYCREIETFLCRKNDGHLIRLVGPAFEQVCGWAARGVPLKVVFRGVDRYFDRYYAKGPRRRPVRIEFCEADVLDVFDDWRRAVGIGLMRVREDGPDAAEPDSADQEARASGRRPSLRAHLDRILTRLTTLESRSTLTTELESAVDSVIRDLDDMREPARRARGAVRLQLISRLDELDRQLLEVARRAADPQTLASIRRDAELELDAFRARMPEPAFQHALEACIDRGLRDHFSLPEVRLP